LDSLSKNIFGTKNSRPTTLSCTLFGWHARMSKGNDVIARIPVGTQVFDVDTGECLADLTHHGMQAVICKGGSGGFGNTRFASSTRQAPDFANPGLPGDERNLRLSLKLMADVGLLGFPNAGKSTLLSRVSAAKPKIADYPFTTLIPQLGVVRAPEGKSFVMADIPGLIEGASEGIGLGVRFLKHLERVRVLCHLIEPLPYDFANEEGKLSLVQRYETIRKELAAFNPELCELPEIVVLSKMDLLSQVESEEEIQALEQTLAAQHVRLLRMSAATGEGIHELVTALWVIIAGAKKSEKDDKTLGFDPARG